MDFRGDFNSIPSCSVTFDQFDIFVWKCFVLWIFFVVVFVLFLVCLLALAKFGSNKLNETQIKGRIFNSTNQYESSTHCAICSNACLSLGGSFLPLLLFDSFTCSRRIDSYMEQKCIRAMRHA